MDEELLAAVSSVGVVYAAMLVATLGGQIAGVALESASGTRGFWLPAILSVALEAMAGSKVGASRAGHSLSPAENGRLSMHYSLGLVGVSIPLAGWIAAARPPERPLPIPWASPSAWAIALGTVVAATAARWVLMMALSPRRR